MEFYFLHSTYHYCLRTKQVFRALLIVTVIGGSLHTRFITGKDFRDYRNGEVGFCQICSLARTGFTQYSAILFFLQIQTFLLLTIIMSLGKITKVPRMKMFFIS